jgi:TolB-like protein
MSIYALGPFRLDTEDKIVYRGSEPVLLGRRAVEVLCTLVEHSGTLVSKQTLIEAVWGRQVIDEANLTVQIGAIRRAFGQKKDSVAWIETLPRRGYRFIGPVAMQSQPAQPRTDLASARKDPTKPSIAVLPFRNMSGDPEHEYFADGIVEEIIGALSRFQQLSVSARHQSFIFKGRTGDPRQVALELGVRYLLDGSVRRIGGRVRILAQLVDGANATTLWADRFDGSLENVFDLQDLITSNVVCAVAPTMENAEIRRAQSKARNLDAYDHYLRGLARFHVSTNASIRDALRFFHRAIALDPGFAAAYGMAAWCHVRRKGSRWVSDAKEEAREAAALIAKAIDLGRNDAVALASAGYALAYVVGDSDQGSAFLEKAVVTNPNLAWAPTLCGWPKIWRGDLAASVELESRAISLNPHDPQLFLMESATAFANLCAGRYDDASRWAAKAITQQPHFPMSPAVLAASEAHAGRLGSARKALVRFRKLDPTLRVPDLKSWTPFQQPEHREMWTEGLRKAGLPK